MAERRPLIWLASFPKSGNTWLRGMLCRAICGVDAELEDMGTLIPALNSERDFEGNLLDRAAAAMEKRGCGDRPVFAKTHRPFYEVELREAVKTGVFEHFATDRIIYVVRNPLDVAVSLFDFVQLNEKAQNEPVEALFRSFLDAFVAREGHVAADYVHAVDLNEHVQSYLYAAELHRALFVRYEDMHARPVEELDRVCAFAGIALPPATLAAVAESCSFGRMRQLEESKIVAEDDGGHEFYRPWRTNGYAKGLRFFNKGQVGRGHTCIDPAVRRRFRETFHRAFEAFGYSAEEASSA